jgi:hypothetical protein
LRPEQHHCARARADRGRILAATVDLARDSQRARARDGQSRKRITERARDD